MSKVIRRSRFIQALPNTIIIPQYEQNDYGESILKEFLEGNIFMAEILPLSGTMARHITGVTENSTHNLFTKCMVDGLKANNYVRDNNANYYLITYIEDWKTHITAILEAKKL